MRLFLLCCIFAIVLSSPAQSATIRVPADQPTIQAGINAAAPVGDTVLVAPGTYMGPGNKNLNPMGKALVLVSEAGAESTIIDCEFQGRGIYFQAGEDGSTVVDGFTLRRGIVDGSFPDNWGGGVLCIGSSPSIRNCVITENESPQGSGRGGGLALYDSSPSLSNCTIIQNRAFQGHGGGVYCYSMSRPTMVSTTIANNVANSGGGVFCDATSSPVMPGCTLADNDANSGGGIYYSQTAGLTLDGVTFVGNQANSGAAIYLEHASIAITGCRLEANSGNAIFCGTLSAPTITECVFFENNGAGLSINASPRFMRCVFNGNLSQGLYSTGTESSLSIESCTFYQNILPVVIDQGSALIDRTIIAFSKTAAVTCASGVALSCCDLYANLGGNWIGCISDQQGVNGNFTGNPRFCDPPSGDFRIHGLSPCAPGNAPPGCGLIGALPVGCGVADVAEEAPSVEFRLTVIPNPVRSAARFELESAEFLSKLNIFDSQGRLIERLSGQDGRWEWMPGSAVPAGVYFAKPEAVVGSVGPSAMKFLYLR